MQRGWETEQIKKIIEARDPRAFLRLALDEKAKCGRKFGFSALARLSGFSSRSYPREVLLGKKNLTPTSATAIARQGLKLSSELTEYFLLLVEQDAHRRGKPTGKSAAKIDRQVTASRSRIRQKLEGTRNSGDEVYSVANISIVFAAMGTPERGASLEEIMSRSGLSREAVSEVVIKLKEFGLVREENKRLFPIVNHVAFENLKANGAFQKMYVGRLKTAIRKAETHFESDKNLFLESSFTISKELMPKLKVELRELLNRFVEEKEVPEGSTVASLTCALFSPDLDQ